MDAVGTSRLDALPARVPWSAWDRVVCATVAQAPPQAAWEAEVPLRGDLGGLATLVGSGGVCVLSGAGMSTDSGIPDYRGPSSAARRHAPMTYDAFVADPGARHRYWARSHVGWPQIDRARPNEAHRAVAALQRTGLVTDVITQNVDGLHQAAGAPATSSNCTARSPAWSCLGCDARHDRADVQARLAAVNRDFDADVAALRSTQVNPDGDAELPAGLVERLHDDRLPGVRRGAAQARRRVLRGVRPAAPGRVVLRASGPIAGAARPRFVPRRDVRSALRAGRGPCRDPRGHRHRRAQPRGRSGVREACVTPG